MGPFHTILILASIFLQFSKGDAAFCETGWMPYKDELCIKYFPNLLTYDEAKQFCSSQSNQRYTASLVMVKDDDMQEVLASYTHNVFNSLWLGGKYDDDAAHFLWDDGEPLASNNWQAGYPRNTADSDSCIELRPSNAKQSLNYDGKWADVFCRKRNLVMCQRTALWTLQDVVAEIKRMRKHFEEELEAVKSKVIPVGSIYVEYSNQPSPLVLWPTLSWEDISETYAGLFFRTSGGGAEDWGVTQTECAPRITDMAYTRNRNGYPWSISIPQSGWSDFGVAGCMFEQKSGIQWFEALRYNTQDCEVRPKNQAIRIWKRTG